MSDVVLIISSGLVMIYGVVILALIRRLNPGHENFTDPRLSFREAHALPFVSVVVSVRNEAKNIGMLINSLSGQNYKGGFEIILADDHSTDDTARIISAYASPAVYYLPPVSDAVGKKLNLDRAVSVARGEIILTTDADCIHLSGWISAMTECFSDKQVQMVTGPVNILRTGFFSGLQSVEFLSLMAATRISAELKNPVMANGANLGYRKTVYQLTEGYADNHGISSGDDQFLLAKVKKKFPEGIRFAKNPQAVVMTNASATITEFLHQRLRWAGKWNREQGNLTRLTAVMVMLIQICTIFLMVSPVFNQYPWFLFLAFKVIPDYFLLSATARLQNLSWHHFEFLIVSFCYPFYVLITGLLSFFITPDWKSRPVST